MAKRLTLRETRRAIRQLGIDQTPGADFGLFDGAKNVRYAFHRHTRHQLMFPASGVLFVEAGANYFACTPDVGLWVPAGVKHATTTGLGETVSVFFSPVEYRSMGKEAVMVRITPLLREAARHAAAEPDSVARSKELFRVMYGMVKGSALNSAWPSLPVGRSEIMRRTLDAALLDLSAITIPGLARLSGQSERTMRRRFLKELGMGPEQFLQRARLMRAMQGLIGEGTRSITEIALEVGYSNHSAFSAAFRRFTGKSPKDFRAAGRGLL